MRTYFVLGCALLLSVAVLAGCDTAGDDSSGEVTLTGQVLNAETNNPVSGAFVRVSPLNVIIETDVQGRFNVVIEVDSTMDLDLTATKEGFSSDFTSVLALAGRVIEVPTFRLQQLQAEGPESGKASNILLLSQSALTLGVKESGSEEVVGIVFQVADSLGRPVSLDNSVDVRFTLGQQPGGGEFIFPEIASTDNNGQVRVNLSSGIRAGAVQIVAEASIDGRTIRSLPVVVAIHGGLPDQEHFTIGPQVFNFPGLRRFGLVDVISVIVGDKFSNPVKPGTVVYFSTTHGVIEGSAITNTQGGGSVSLLSANPLPPDGIAVVTARTADEDQAQVSGQTAVVFSGVPVITVSPSVAILDQSYQLTVTDQNGNPLVEGTSINVSVQGTRVKGVGNTEVSLDDTAFLGGLTYEDVLRGPGITRFTFSAVADLGLDEGGSPEIESITIRVSGGNGTLEVVLPKLGAPLAKTENTIVEMIGSDTVKFQLDE